MGLVGAAVLGACGGDDDSADGPRIVVTTNILGDVVREVVGDAADVEVIMPLGADPHEFSASARQAEAMEDADLLVVNGEGFEEGLHEIVEQAEDNGVEVFAFTDHVELLPFEEHAEEEGDAEAEEHAEEEEHGGDPHVWTDPTNIRTAVEALRPVLNELEGIDQAAIDEQTDAYLAELATLDSEIEAQLAAIPAERRVLVTNHDVFGYFAQRYGFEVVGVVIPGGTTLAEPSSAELEDLRAVIESRQVPAIFAETTDSTRLADALAEEVGDVEVVTLFTESLGDEGSGAETYVGLMRTDAGLIADALQ